MEMKPPYWNRIVGLIVAGVALLGGGWETNLSGEEQPRFLIAQGTAKFASARKPMETGTTGALLPGQQIETGEGGTVVVFLPSGAAMALTAEGRLQWNSTGFSDAVSEWSFQLGAGSLIVRLPEDRLAERLRLQSVGGEVQAEEGAFVMSVFHREDVDRAQLIGVESGSVRFLPNGENPSDSVVIHGGDAITLRRLVEDGSKQSPISHQIFTGDLRYRFLAGLAEITQAQLHLGKGLHAGRSTRAPTTIPAPDFLPAPRELLIEAELVE